MGSFDVGKRFSYIDINAICEKFISDTSLALPAFHSFTGCDTTYLKLEARILHGKLGSALMKHIPPPSACTQRGYFI